MRETDPWKRIAKVFPLLSSDTAGDVTAAASAISKILKGEGLDWHALAKRIEAPPAADPPPWQEDARPNGDARQGRQERQERPSWTKPEDGGGRRPYGDSRRKPSAWKQDKEDVERAYNANGSSRLDAWSMDFLHSVHEWTVEQGRSLTDRQRDKLNEILDKLNL